MDVKDVSSTTFGYIIGFLLPGMVAIYGLGFVSVDVASLLKPATAPEATLGPSLLLLLAALTVGMVVTAIRFVAFEKGICRAHKFQDGFFEKLGTAEKLASFRAAVDEHYRYHQFFGGLSVALIPLYGGWIWKNHAVLSTCRVLTALGTWALLEILMVYCASNGYQKYVDRSNRIVAGVQAKREGMPCQTDGAVVHTVPAVASPAEEVGTPSADLEAKAEKSGVA